VDSGIDFSSVDASIAWNVVRGRIANQKRSSSTG